MGKDKNGVIGGVTSGAFREVPWHGLGESRNNKGEVVGIKTPITDDVRTGRDLLVTAGLDWTVEKRTLQELGLLQEDADQYAAIIRTDKQRILGMHSEKYGEVQNELLGQYTDVIMKARGDAFPVSAVELWGGKVVFLVIEFRDMVKVVRKDGDTGKDGDTMSRYMGVYTSHDGSYPLAVKYMNNLWVCQNTFTPWNAQTGFMIRHTRNANDIAVSAIKSLEEMMTSFDQFDLEISRLLAPRDHDQALARHHHEVVHAVQHHLGTVGMHHVPRRLQRERRPQHGIVLRIAGTHAMQRGPRAHVIPFELPRQHQHAVAALQHPHVDRHRLHLREERRHVVAGRRERRLHFRRMVANLVEQISYAPREDARVPEKAVCHHPRRPLRVRLLHKARHAPHSLAHRSTGLDVAEPGIRARGHDADSDQRSLLKRHAGRLGEGGPVGANIANGPIRMHADHHRVGARALRDHLRRPRQRRARARRPRFGDHVLGRQRGLKRQHRLA